MIGPTRSRIEFMLPRSFSFAGVYAWWASFPWWRGKPTGQWQGFHITCLWLSIVVYSYFHVIAQWWAYVLCLPLFPYFLAYEISYQHHSLTRVVCLWQRGAPIPRCRRSASGVVYLSSELLGAGESYWFICIIIVRALPLWHRAC